jgi:DNA-binding GntR family transcriptional regulator
MFTTVISETRLCLGMLTSGLEGRDDLVEEHREISEMIRAENPAAAVEALRKSFDDAVVTLKHQLAADREDEQAG